MGPNFGERREPQQRKSKGAGKYGQFAVAVSKPGGHFEAAPISYV